MPLNNGLALTRIVHQTDYIFIGMGFDYWALGHIHKHTVVQAAHPAIIYPGNLQGRDFGETGPKGCCLVEISPGHTPVTRFISSQLIRFEELQVDMSGDQDLNGLSGKAEKAVGALRARKTDCRYPERIWSEPTAAGIYLPAGNRGLLFRRTRHRIGMISGYIRFCANDVPWLGSLTNRAGRNPSG